MGGQPFGRWSDEPPLDGRRWDIDWLRVLAVLLLVPYHAAATSPTRHD